MDPLMHMRELGDAYARDRAGDQREGERMKQQPSEWAMGEARKTATSVWGDLRDRRGFGARQVGVDAGVESEIIGTWTNIIAHALDAARNVTDGCVRLPDGSDIEPPPYVTHGPGLVMPWSEYAERAAEAARKDGTR